MTVAPSKVDRHISNDDQPVGRAECADAVGVAGRERSSMTSEASRPRISQISQRAQSRAFDVGLRPAKVESVPSRATNFDAFVQLRGGRERQPCIGTLHTPQASIVNSPSGWPSPRRPPNSRRSVLQPEALLVLTASGSIAVVPRTSGEQTKRLRFGFTSRHARRLIYCPTRKFRGAATRSSPVGRCKGSGTHGAICHSSSRRLARGVPEY